MAAVHIRGIMLEHPLLLLASVTKMVIMRDCDEDDDDDGDDDDDDVNSNISISLGLLGALCRNTLFFFFFFFWLP